MIDTITAVAAIFVAWVWATVKLVKWSLGEDDRTVRAFEVKLLYQGMLLAVTAVLVLAFGEGIGGWLGELWAWLLRRWFEVANLL